MMPPICCVCDERFDDLDNGGLVQFKRRPEDEVWDLHMSDSGMTGHPPYVKWFCPAHFAEGKALEDLTVDVALARLQGAS
jgi:hypothetical protein